jgi:hypothetical protein
MSLLGAVLVVTFIAIVFSAVITATDSVRNKPDTKESFLLFVTLFIATQTIVWAVIGIMNVFYWALVTFSK